MDRKIKWIGGAALVVAVIGGGTGFAVASSAGDDAPITGPALAKATAAALQHTGGGTVVETEVGDRGTAYGIEVRLDDGRTVEVALDTNFNVVGQEADDDGPNDLGRSHEDGS